MTSDVDLEPRPLRSAGVTRFHRYYGPLRHPVRPGRSLAGVRLKVTRSHRWGFPCCGRFPCTDMPTPIPRWDGWVCLSLLPQPTAAFPENSTGRLPRLGLSRPARRSLTFRPACLLDRRKRPVAPKASTDSLPPPPLRLLPAGATRRRVGIAPTGNRRLCTAHEYFCHTGEHSTTPPQKIFS
jgi:hypothetical protein